MSSVLGRIWILERLRSSAAVRASPPLDWREALGGDSDEGYFDEEGRPVARAEFRYILSRAASVYANSQYTRSILQSVYGVRCPVIYSVPRELERRDEA